MKLKNLFLSRYVKDFEEIESGMKDVNAYIFTKDTEHIARVMINEEGIIKFSYRTMYQDITTFKTFDPNRQSPREMIQCMDQALYKPIMRKTNKKDKVSYGDDDEKTLKYIFNGFRKKGKMK